MIQEIVELVLDEVGLNRILLQRPSDKAGTIHIMLGCLMRKGRGTHKPRNVHTHTLYLPYYATSSPPDGGSHVLRSAVPFICSYFIRHHRVACCVSCENILPNSIQKSQPSYSSGATAYNLVYWSKWGGSWQSTPSCRYRKVV